MKANKENKVYFISLLVITAFFYLIILSAMASFPVYFQPLVSEIGMLEVYALYLAVSIFLGSILALIPWGIAKYTSKSGLRRPAD